MSRPADIAARLSEFSARVPSIPSRISSIRPPRLGLVVLVLIVLGAGYGAYMGWVRDLSLFRVQHVTVSGLEGKEAPAIRRALREAAKRMTTLHVRPHELEQAVDSFAVVRSVSASADFPKTLRVTVNEYEPVAALVARDGRRAAVSRAQTVLRSVGAKTALPTVQVDAIPTEGSIEDEQAQVLVDVLAEAPRRMRRVIARAYSTAHGIRISLRKGPVLHFGSDRRLAAKWAAAARVLADEASRGAEFIDVRLPERPVAGGFEPGAGSTGPHPAAADPQL